MSLIVTNSHLVTAFLHFWRTLDSWWFPSCCKALSDHNRPQPTPQFQCARSRLPFAYDWIYRKREWIWEKLRNEMAWMKHNETFRIVALVAEHFGILVSLSTLQESSVSSSEFDKESDLGDLGLGQRKDWWKSWKAWAAWSFPLRHSPSGTLQVASKYIPQVAWLGIECGDVVSLARKT